MKRLQAIASFCLALGLFTVVGSRQPSIAAEKPDKVRFTYAPLSASGFLWFIAKDAGYFEKYRLDVDMYFEGASPIMVQSILAGENQLAGGAGPAVVTNVIQGGDVITVGLHHSYVYNAAVCAAVDHQLATTTRQKSRRQPLGGSVASHRGFDFAPCRRRRCDHHSNRRHPGIDGGDDQRQR